MSDTPKFPLRPEYASSSGTAFVVDDDGNPVPPEWLCDMLNRATAPQAPMPWMREVAEKIDMYYTTLVKKMIDDVQEGRLKRTLESVRSEVAALIAATAPQARNIRCPICNGEGEVGCAGAGSCSNCDGSGYVALSTHPQASEPEVRRAGFEKWMRSRRATDAELKRSGDGYWFAHANISWLAWQAASRRAPHPLASRAIALIRGMVENRIDHASPKFAELVREWDAAGDVLTESEREAVAEATARIGPPDHHHANVLNGRRVARLLAIINRLTGKEGRAGGGGYSRAEP